jgi:H(+)-transporting ATP synthase subunit D
MRTRVTVSRSNLLRYAHRLDQVRRGAALLTRKRQSLVEELFARARTAMTSREAIELQARRAWHSIWLALSAQGSDRLRPLGWPTRVIDVELQALDLWGIRSVQVLHRPTLARSMAARAFVAGPGEAAISEAAREFELLLERLIDAAPQENTMRRLGRALSRTTRLVNTLEQRVAVNLRADLAEISRTLSEREREDHLRIKRLVARRHHAALRSK